MKLYLLHLKKKKKSLTAEPSRQHTKTEDIFHLSETITVKDNMRSFHCL